MDHTRLIRVVAAVLTAAVFIGLAGCSQAVVPNAIDPAFAPKGPGWIALGNGRDLTGWHPRATDRPMSWKVVDGVMVNESTHEKPGVDIITDAKYGDFELYYEYKVAPHSNSGMYMRGRYELQILDDEPDTSADSVNGAFYSLAAPAKKASRAAGEWQSVYARLVGKTVCVALNGEVIHCCVELSRPTGGELDGDVDQPGPIMVQGDHGSLEIRNLYLRPIADAAKSPCPMCRCKTSPGGKEGCSGKAGTCAGCEKCAAGKGGGTPEKAAACPSAQGCEKAASCPKAAAQAGAGCCDR